MSGLALQIPLIGMGTEAFLILLVTALAGGAFGAALGALPSFIFTGFVVLLGEGLAILEGNIAGVGGIPAGEIATGVTGVVGFGPVVGPHIAFAGGVAASAYAGKKYPEMGPKEGYHFGKEIAYAFGTKPDILAVGAAFGVLGAVVNQVAAGLGLPLDTIALTVFLSAVLVRVAFGYPLIGKPAGDGYLDMTPFERGEERTTTDGDFERVRPATEPWLPHQYKWSGVTVIGLVGGILGAFIWLETGSFFLGYGISAASLLFLNLGVEKIPVTHHITLLGSSGAAIGAAAVSSPLVALLVGGVFGALSGLLGEVTQRVFYAHSGTHVDPPAMAITLMTVFIGVLYLIGLLPSSAYLGL
ncbi:hypothetical protein [Halogeometricum luteum]|uniref:DUF7973 domain-containing protein n=1 Tax=Halogeometricum luteum TaxID=2950537 RepID=A0ABU2FZE2_9EURY|nr:hypothetical protein [Halogeometricum sp. S3BR5-2]MDS0293906.1 hypothetical protein [Halogeometricum sp. S3BR5-2]